MEMYLDAHCGSVNAGSYVSFWVMTDVGSGWTECVPVLVRPRALIVDTIKRLRQAMPFALLSLDTDKRGVAKKPKEGDLDPNVIEEVIENEVQKRLHNSRAQRAVRRQEMVEKLMQNAF